MNDFEIALVVALIALAVERLWSLISEKMEDRRAARTIRDFLHGWWREAESVLEETRKGYEEDRKVWADYRESLETSPQANPVFPCRSFFRILLPDVGPVVVNGLRHMSESAYVNLLYLNARLRLLDERGRRLEGILDGFVVTHPTRESRLRMAQVVLEIHQNVLDLISEVWRFHSNEGLMAWLENRASIHMQERAHNPAPAADS
ncbi:MAG TPA: hypothetical protein VF179_30445 [Thermoanaerobaculia bacterium]|nr:hypothetical protein [Thermoanaerobaculia bacterium]